MRRITRYPWHLGDESTLVNPQRILYPHWQVHHFTIVWNTSTYWERNWEHSRFPEDGSKGLWRSPYFSCCATVEVDVFVVLSKRPQQRLDGLPGDVTQTSMFLFSANCDRFADLFTFHSAQTSNHASFILFAGGGWSQSQLILGERRRGKQVASPSTKAAFLFVVINTTTRPLVNSPESLLLYSQHGLTRTFSGDYTCGSADESGDVKSNICGHMCSHIQPFRKMSRTSVPVWKQPHRDNNHSHSICMSLGCGSRGNLEKPTQFRGEHKNTQKGPSMNWDVNQEPSRCEVTNHCNTVPSQIYLIMMVGMIGLREDVTISIEIDI